MSDRLRIQKLVLSVPNLSISAPPSTLPYYKQKGAHGNLALGDDDRRVFSPDGDGRDARAGDGLEGVFDLIQLYVPTIGRI